MKKIDAIIRLSRFEVIRDALAEIDVRFFTLAEVKGFGLQRGEKLTYRGSVYDADYIARLQLSILCNEDKVDEIVDVICASGRTGKVGDGKITVTNLDRVVRIRTGEENESAI